MIERFETNLEAQVLGYCADFYRFFGITPLTIWQLPYSHFVQMVADVDYQRRHEAMEQARADRERQRGESQIAPGRVSYGG